MENFWKVMENIGKKLIFLFSYLLALVSFLALFFTSTSPLPLLELITATAIAVCILSLIFLFLFSLKMKKVAKERLSYYNNMNRINRRINRVLTGDRVAWHLMR